MLRIKIVFSECEHSGDLENYLEDIQKSGGRVICSSVGDEEEVGEVIVDIEDKGLFLAQFKTTDSFGFSNLG